MVLSLVSAVIVVTSAHPDSLKTRQVTGNVTAIDTKSNTVTIEKKDRRVTVSVSEKSDIIQCIPKRSITDIMIGDRVTAKYVESEDENRAKSITIRESTQ
jgi:ribosomal protein S1